MKRPAARYGFNPFPEPKKGVNRMINKRPACMKSLSWHNIPYVKEKNTGGFVRMEQTKWKRNIKELLSASDKDIVNMLIEDRLLPDWQGALCPHCQRGKLSALTSNGRDQILRHRCSAKNCQRYFLPHHLHPSSPTAKVLKAILYKCRQPHFSFVCSTFPSAASTSSPISATRRLRA